MTILAYSFVYRPPTPSQLETRLILYPVLVLAVILALYVFLKLARYEARYAACNIIIGVSLGAVLIVPTIGPSSVGFSLFGIASLCASMELLRYEALGKLIGALGIPLSLWFLYHVIPESIPHYLMTGRI
jgi:hypothetical protein